MTSTSGKETPSGGQPQWIVVQGQRGTLPQWPGGQGRGTSTGRTNAGGCCIQTPMGCPDRS
eukprot:1224106-Rhodomonas_salina.1